MLPGLPTNVFLDPASSYEWRELNETAFLTGFLGCLRQEMGDAFTRFSSYHILSSHDPAVAPASADGRGVLFFISDESGTPPTHLIDRYAVIFKAYLRQEMPGTNIFPFSIGYAKDIPGRAAKPVLDRHFDVFFSGNLNSNRRDLYRAAHPLLGHLPRPVGLKLLRFASTRDLSRGRDYLRFTDGFRQGLPAQEYADLLDDSRIVFCPMGFVSSETFRHAEALRAGAIVVSERLPDTVLYRYSPIIQVDDWTDGLRRARRLLKQPDHLRDLQESSLAWWQNVLCEAATARHVASVLGQVASNTRAVVSAGSGIGTTT
jgi:hypothetical protein